MTAASLLHFAEALLWLLAVFAAFAGVGDLVLASFGVRRSHLGVAISVGTAAMVLLGGLLNLLHWVTPGVLIAIVAAGLSIAAALRLPAIWRTRRRQAARDVAQSGDVWSKLLLVIFVAVLVLRVSATVHTSYYQSGDDKNFYLAQPVKMLELHWLAPDPFSERRVTSSLGANYFLQDVVLAALPLEDLQMADRGLGLLLLAAISLSLARQFALRRSQALLLGIFALITPQLTFNQSFVVLPSALFLAMVAVAADQNRFRAKPWLQALLLGAIGGSISSMKSTYLPHAVLFCVFLYALRFLATEETGWARLAKSVSLAALGGLSVLAPWMIASRFTSGTWLFPLLGKGYDYTRYGIFPGAATASATVLLHKVVPFTLPLVLVLIAELWLAKPEPAGRDRLNRNILALTIACVVATLMVGISTGGDSVRRYNYPAMVPVALLLYVVFARSANLNPGNRRQRLCEAGSAVAVLLTAISIGTNSWTHEYRRAFKALSTSLTDRPIEPDAVAKEYTALAASLPRDGAVLESLDDPFLLDFRSHTLYLADFPGAASPPPGWPARESGEDLAVFLRGQSVRYLAFSYENETAIDAELARKQDDSNVSAWQRSQSAITLDAHRQFQQLAQSRHRLFDDGKIVVLDLAGLASRPAR